MKNKTKALNLLGEKIYFVTTSRYVPNKGIEYKKAVESAEVIQVLFSKNGYIEIITEFNRFSFDELNKEFSLTNFEVE